VNDIFKARRPLALVNQSGIIHLQRRNPYIIAWWSAAFPGFGHFLMQKYVTGVLLTLSEVITNSLSGINLAMVYSFCGRFDMAKAIVQPKWMFGYMILYFFAIWDSCCYCREMNKLTVLAEAENARIRPFSLRPIGVQFLAKRQPVAAAICSAFFPGLGQLYVQRLGLAIYGIFWWWMYITLSHAYESLHLLLNGLSKQALAALRPQWLLFMPSVAGGSIYHAYITAVEDNRIFRYEQRQFLSEHYGSLNQAAVTLPPDCRLWVAGTFEHTIELEQALVALEQMGIPRCRTVPVLMDISPREASAANGRKTERSIKAVEIALAGATASSVIGMSLGFALDWGPIIWGIIAAVGGFALCVLLYFMLSGLFGKAAAVRRGRLPEVTLLVETSAAEAPLIERLLWEHRALTVGRTGKPPDGVDRSTF